MAPSFSIIIATYSRPTQLAACLESLSRLDYSRDRYEVIVVDDGGDPPAASVVARAPPTLRISQLRQANAGPAAARNLGAASATGNFLAFTDDDCLPQPDWLTAMARALTAYPGCMVGGATVNANVGNLCSATSQLIQDIVYRHYNVDPERARFLASNNLALAAAAFREIGGFDPGFRTAEDRELCDRWLAGGRRLIYYPPARVAHVRHLTLWSFCRQHFGYGMGAGRFHRQRASRHPGGPVADFRFHLDIRNWLWGPITAAPPRQVVPLAVLIGAWQISNLAGFLWESFRLKR